MKVMMMMMMIENGIVWNDMVEMEEKVMTIITIIKDNYILSTYQMIYFVKQSLYIYIYIYIYILHFGDQMGFVS